MKHTKQETDILLFNMLKEYQKPKLNCYSISETLLSSEPESGWLKQVATSEDPGFTDRTWE